MPNILPPPMTPEKAREVGLSLKAMADYLAEAGDVGFARTMQRQNEWYLAHASTLAIFQSGTAPNPDALKPESPRDAGQTAFCRHHDEGGGLMPDFPPAPVMTPENAREVGLSLKATADYLAEAGVVTLARTMQRQGEWYLAHALTLATIQSGTAPNPSDTEPGNAS